MTRPCVELVLLQRPRRLVCRQQRLRPRFVETAVRLHAPVVHGDCNVIEPRVGAREVEIDDARDPAAFEQDIVPEQIRVNRAVRQIPERIVRLELDLMFEEGRVFHGQEGEDLGLHLLPPVQAPRVVHASGIASYRRRECARAWCRRRRNGLPSVRSRRGQAETQRALPVCR